MNYEEEINKLKFQMQMIGESIDYKEYPIQSLILSYDWSQEELNTAYDIFDEIEKELEEGKNNSHKLEILFNERLGLGYQSVKSVVNAFYRNGQWMSTCMIYAMEHMVTEFHEILDDFNKLSEPMFEKINNNLKKSFDGEKTLKEIYNDDKEWDNIEFGLKIPFISKIKEKSIKNELPIKILKDDNNPTFIYKI